MGILCTTVNCSRSPHNNGEGGSTLLNLEFGCQGMYNHKSCQYWNECPMCSGPRAFIACLRAKSRRGRHKPERSRPPAPGKGSQLSKDESVWGTSSWLCQLSYHIICCDASSSVLFCFCIPFQGPCLSIMYRNSRSIQDMEQAVKNELGKEIWEGRILGPFGESLVSNLHCP